jgi:hypothetical protein
MLDPVFVSGIDQLFRRVIRKMDTIPLTRTFNTRSRVDSVSKTEMVGNMKAGEEPVGA